MTTKTKQTKTVDQHVKKASKKINKQRLSGWDVPIEAVIVGLVVFVVPAVLYITILRLVFNLKTTALYSEFVARPEVNLSIYIVISMSCYLIVKQALKKRGRSFKEIGYVRPKLFDVINIFAAYAVYVIALKLVFAAIVSLFPSADLGVVQETGYKRTTNVGLIIAFVGLVIIPPIYEELLFRGFLYHGLKTKLSIIPSAIITSVLFSMVHSPWTAQVDVFLLSLALCWLVEVTGSIWVAVGLHAFKNFLAYVVVFILQR